MARKIVQAVIAIIIVGVGFAAFNKLKSQKKSQDKKSEKSIKFVRTLTVNNEDVSTTIPVTGRLVARQKISVIAEVMGKMESGAKDFKEGVSFQKGEVMLRIDPNEFEMNLMAQKSAFLNLIAQMMPDLKLDFPKSAQKWNGFISSYDLKKPIPPYPDATSDQEKFFLASRNVYQQYYSIKSLEERFNKYIIKAPFAGTVSVSNVYPGMTIPAGQMLGEYLDPNSYEIETTVRANDIKLIKAGSVVKLKSETLNSEWDGMVVRISDKLDPSTQSVKVFIAVQGTQLKEGLYLSGDIETGVLEEAFVLPRKLLVDDQYVYALADTLLRKSPVEVLKVNRESVVVKGLKDGTILMDETLPGAYDGMPAKQKKSATPQDKK